MSLTIELRARFDEIKADTQVDARMMNHEPSCNTTHHPGCDCQIQRYIREKFDLIAIIDRLVAENASMLSGSVEVVARKDARIVDLNQQVERMAADREAIKKAWEKFRTELPEDLNYITKESWQALDRAIRRK